MLQTKLGKSWQSGSGAGDEKTIWISSIWKNALAQLSNRVRGRGRQAGRQRRAWQFFSFWTSAAWISNGLPVFQFYLQISGFCWAKTCFQWQHVLFFSSLAPGGLNFHRFSNFCSKIHCFRRYKTAIFPLTLGTLDFLFFEHSFQIQRFEGQVLKSFFSRPLTP